MQNAVPRLAHVILAHTDPAHIARLSRKLAAFSDVYIHIEANAALEPFSAPVRDLSNVHFLEHRLHCRWGGWNAVEATVNLLKAALAGGDYDRIVFLQGADYPLYAPGELLDFFAANQNTEFIRACDVSRSSDPYFKEMCRVVFFRNKEDVFHKVLEKVFQHGRIYLRGGRIPDDSGKLLDACWGSAQWAITAECARYVTAFHDSHPRFNRWFEHAFPTDEMYFATVVMNSPFAEKTSHGGLEPARRGLVNWRNLHYFEYPGSIRVYEAADWDFLQGLGEPYVRKVNTEKSTELLDRLDAEHARRDKARKR